MTLRRDSRRMAAAAASLFLLIPTTLHAQARVTSADLSGTVVDGSGAFVPGVTVTATHVETNVSRTVASDERGRYMMAALQPGPYRIIAKLSGYTTARDPRQVQLAARLIF